VSGNGVRKYRHGTVRVSGWRRVVSSPSAWTKLRASVKQRTAGGSSDPDPAAEVQRVLGTACGTDGAKLH